MPIDLPLPPSVNALWRSARGRVYRSERYAEWRVAAGWALKVQKPVRIAGPVVITIAAGRPDRRRRDVDNLGKAVLDLLVGHQVIEDDANVVTVTAGWDTAVPPGIVRVTIEAAKVIAYAKV